jgi:hypothetical protein
VIAGQAEQWRGAVRFDRRQKLLIHLNPSRMHQIPGRNDGIRPSFTHGLSQDRIERRLSVRMQKLLVRRNQMTVGDV